MILSDSELVDRGIILNVTGCACSFRTLITFVESL